MLGEKCMKDKLSRDEARELYDDLKRAMDKMLVKNGGSPLPEPASSAPNSKVAKEIASAIRAGLGSGGGQSQPKAAPQSAPSRPTASSRPIGQRSSTSSMLKRPAQTQRGRASGAYMAISTVMLLGSAKVFISILEAVGMGDIPVAQATVVAAPSVEIRGAQWSKEEAQILTSLDHRRSELEERRVRLDEREDDLQGRDRELIARLAELRDLTEKLKMEREKSSKQRGTQMEQLANVYGSMNPPEAAHLLEQLDVTVALSLIERMPEKRIGQILQLMSADKALTITKLLSSRAKM